MAPLIAAGFAFSATAILPAAAGLDRNRHARISAEGCFLFSFDFVSLPLWLNLPIFVTAGCAVWRIGARLSLYADVIAERTGLGRAFAGILLLGTATSLPELTTIATAAASDHPRLAGTNLLGGIALQTAVLAVVDATALPDRALTFFSPRAVLLMQGVMLVFILAVAAAAMTAGEFASFAGVGFWPALLAVLYGIELYLIYRYEGNPRWEPSGEIAVPPRPAVDRKDAHERRYAGLDLKTLGFHFAAAALGVLVSGYLVARTGIALAEQTGLGENFVGATLVAVATSLPEFSTTFAAVRLGAYSMAIGNIFGTNAFQIALFLPADLLYRGQSIFAALDRSAVFLAWIAIASVCIYLWGLLERRDQTVFGMGIDSALVLGVYACGMLLFYVIR